MPFMKCTGEVICKYFVVIRKPNSPFLWRSLHPESRRKYDHVIPVPRYHAEVELPTAILLLESDVRYIGYRAKNLGT